MRFIHTADWHLGRIFYGIHLTEDQSWVLDQIVDLVRDSKADALLISGDIYDRAVPPPEAVSLLDEVLCRLVLDLKLKVFISSGNHDSPDRLNFGSRLLAKQGLYVAGSLAPDPVRADIEDADGPIRIWMLPYAEPAVVRARLNVPEIIDHNSAMAALLGRMNIGNSSRNILMVHAFASGAETCESERPLSIGGSGTVDARLFERFDYVALGHLHRPQSAGRTGYYPGSLLKYSFSEINHAPSVNLVEIDSCGNLKLEKVPLRPRRGVRRIEGSLKELLESPAPNRDDYLMVVLSDKGAILDPMGKLREVYPNVLHLERPELRSGPEIFGRIGDHRRMSDIDLFSAFFAEVTSEPLSREQSEAYSRAIDDLRLAERESSR